MTPQFTCAVHSHQECGRTTSPPLLTPNKQPNCCSTSMGTRAPTWYAPHLHFLHCSLYGQGSLEPCNGSILISRRRSGSTSSPKQKHVTSCLWQRRRSKSCCTSSR